MLKQLLAESLIIALGATLFVALGATVGIPSGPRAAETQPTLAPPIDMLEHAERAIERRGL
jgi:hypothetical protein